MFTQPDGGRKASKYSDKGLQQIKAAADKKNDKIRMKLISGGEVEDAILQGIVRYAGQEMFHSNKYPAEDRRVFYGKVRQFAMKSTSSFSLDDAWQSFIGSYGARIWKAHR